MKKRIRNIIICGLLFGGILLMLRIVFQMSDEEVWRYYILVSGIILVGAVGINIIYQVKLMKKLKRFETILRDEENPDKFIEENESLLRRLKSEYNRALININLSAGYCDKGDFETAKNILLSIPLKHIKGINKVVYYMNLAYIYFRLEESQKALDILEQQKKAFSNLEKHPSLGGNIMSLRILKYIAQDQLADAQNLLITAKNQWTDKRLLKDWELLQSTINQLNNTSL
ncbi:hypothetical protein acsn021_18050 [Anaerocolumna cellulosilytica]|uniref:Uncharacterized protein n=1 Tax=Anaerocolumna cellulosilytica TaxID=433286 RepID=A0A6S6QWY6_9FIRM|nr:hypothetical protein [Anaerocolumna cellulosilytica]MBB5194800.1 tetratricopeptide (TPR) repeat protein [Anaerocolumna cellulosilytica]BCJ94236.1 hypothetical protein acsn021_18050 [Anaerocolumna cellulosilytica]